MGNIGMWGAKVHENGGFCVLLDRSCCLLVETLAPNVPVTPARKGEGIAGSGECCSTLIRRVMPSASSGWFCWHAVFVEGGPITDLSAFFEVAGAYFAAILAESFPIAGGYTSSA